MIVWGGSDLSSGLQSGGRYDPSIDNWVATTLTGAPSARNYHTAVWTGDSMIVWGGQSTVRENTGAKYDSGAFQKSASGLVPMSFTLPRKLLSVPGKVSGTT